MKRAPRHDLCVGCGGRDRPQPETTRQDWELAWNQRKKGPWKWKAAVAAQRLAADAWQKEQDHRSKQNAAVKVQAVARGWMARMAAMAEKKEGPDNVSEPGDDHAGRQDKDCGGNEVPASNAVVLVKAAADGAAASLQQAKQKTCNDEVLAKDCGGNEVPASNAVVPVKAAADGAAAALQQAKQKTCNDEVLAAAVAQADLEREEIRKELEQAAANWERQREESDKHVPEDERSTNLVCPGGHFLRYTDKRGKCRQCRRRIQKNARAASCSGDCPGFVVCLGCVTSACGEDAAHRLHLAEGLCMDAG